MAKFTPRWNSRSPLSALCTGRGRSAFLPASQEGAAVSWHMGGSDLAAPLTTWCGVFMSIRKVSSPIVLSWALSEGLCLLLLAGAVLSRAASGETPGL